MPLCTAVLAAALLSGPAVVPPDPAPTGTTAAADTNDAMPQWRPAGPVALTPGGAPQAGEFPFMLPQAPPWMAPGGTAGGRGAGPAPESGPDLPDAPGLHVKPGTDGDVVRPKAMAGGVAPVGQAASGPDTSVIPLIDPKTRDVVIQPVSGKPGEAPKPFTFHSVQGVQKARSFPAVHVRKKVIQRPRQQQWPRGW
ncbi:hypothetical protein AB0C10_32000 [Microbispora amethystogenes]|uniref:Uncharacterized protein n=1 Tax=Microbispora amethystogenes TaxID=1427754 RepID=A0ABQ4FKG7_9ACTN|nr:hypothetical protein [Microbispora amethystogenes]GIH35312.1 hypothetical protein Mam01_54760 [Microbispora amethystogenes]